jgi:hypothetical protein
LCARAALLGEGRGIDTAEREIRDCDRQEILGLSRVVDRENLQRVARFGDEIGEPGEILAQRC